MPTKVVSLAAYRSKQGRRTPTAPHPLEALSQEKLSRSFDLVDQKVGEAHRKERGSALRRAELLWAWSRNDNALRLALVKVAISLLTGHRPPSGPDTV